MNLRLLILILVANLAFSITAHAQQYAPGEILIKMKDGSSTQQAYDFFGKAASEKEMTLKTSFGKMNMYHFNLKAGQSVESAIQDIEQDPAVEYAEPNYFFNKATVDEDVRRYTVGEVQSLVGASGFTATNAPLNAGGDCVTTPVGANERPVVAVIDTGLDVDHPVFATSDAVWTNSGEIANNGLDDDGNGYVDDVNGWNFVANSPTMIDDDDHGTHVSGIVLSVCYDISNPSAQSKVRIMPLKFLDGYGVGKTSDAIKAIYYAVQNGATILNNSWGGPSYSGALHEAIAYSYENGVSFVAAAGNAGENNDFAPMFPANYNVPHVISIAATTNIDTLAWFSNFGTGSVHLGSPGVSILSTVPVQGAQQYGTMSGTSMATPFVAGTAAMMAFESPNMMGYQMKNLVFQEADQAAGLLSKVTTESRLDANNSIFAAKNAVVETSLPAYSFTSQDRALASSLAGGGCGLVTKMVNDFRSNQRGGGQGGGPSTWYVLLIVGLMSLPLIVYNVLRNRQPTSRRKHDRYRISSEVTVAVGDRQLVGSISSISLGGVQLNTDALLEDGGIVSMNIASPDGKDQINVEGRIVWSEANRAYGVQFANAKQTVLAQITDWTKSLVKDG